MAQLYGIASLEHFLHKRFHGQPFDLSDAHSLVSALDATANTLELLGRLPATQYAGGGEAKPFLWLEKLSEKLVFKGACKALAVIGPVLDVLVSADRMSKSQHPTASFGHELQALGASTGLVGALYAVAAGTALGGPFGLALIGAQVLLAVVGEIFIAIFEGKHWRDATETCFLGASGKASSEAVERQFRRWVALAASYTISFDPEAAEIVIKPGVLDPKDYFELRCVAYDLARGIAADKTLKLLVKAQGKIVMEAGRDQAEIDEKATKYDHKNQQWEQITIRIRNSSPLYVRPNSVSKISVTVRLHCASRNDLIKPPVGVPDRERGFEIISYPEHAMTGSLPGPTTLTKGTDIHVDVFTPDEPLHLRPSPST
jgi:hypothetical protein